MLLDMVELELETQIEYKDTNGTVKRSNVLTCYKPTAKYRKQTVWLKQEFVRGLVSLQSKYNLGDKASAENSDIEDDNEITAKAIVTIMLVSDIDVYEYQQYFKKFICGVSGLSDLVKVNGEIPFTVTQFDNLTDEDLDVFMGGYLENFLLSSLMKNIAKL